MDMKRAGVVFAVVLLAGLGIYALYEAASQRIAQPEEQEEQPTDPFDPLNASYIVDGSPVKFSDGGASGTMGEFRVVGQPLRADLNNNGRKDAALILAREAGEEETAGAATDENKTTYYAAVALSTTGNDAKGTNAVLLYETSPGENGAAAPTLEIINDTLVADKVRHLYVWGTELREISTQNEFLKVDSPRPYDRIGNPTSVTGQANFFEANVRIRIKDTAGNVLADTFTTATGWMDALYPFSTEVPYTKPAAADGIVEIFEESAEDGSKTNKVSIPVIFRNPS